MFCCCSMLTLGNTLIITDACIFQVIPWVINDSQYSVNGNQGNVRNKYTVFVGALHGMITAAALASIMEELFGPVLFAGLDTDKHKYPIGKYSDPFLTYSSIK